MIVIENKYDVGKIVLTDNLPRIVTGFTVHKTAITIGSGVTINSWHFEFEIT